MSVPDQLSYTCFIIIRIGASLRPAVLSLDCTLNHPDLIDPGSSLRKKISQSSLGGSKVQSRLRTRV